MENKKYELRDRTPKELRCIAEACPAIYETQDVTPKKMRCGTGVCPAIHKIEESYLIIGELINPADAGLEKKVGEGEVLIKVPRKLIDYMEK